jgi:hypothetical protein
MVLFFMLLSKGNKMLIKVSELQGNALDWAVAKCEDSNCYPSNWAQARLAYSTDWRLGGPIIERENITLIRANSIYRDGKNIPCWFAETSLCVGHNVNESYEHQYMDPTFMVSEDGGIYGPTPLIAAMRCYVASKVGDTIEIPDELLGE